MTNFIKKADPKQRGGRRFIGNIGISGMPGVVSLPQYDMIKSNVNLKSLKMSLLSERKVLSWKIKFTFMKKILSKFFLLSATILSHYIAMIVFVLAW